MASFNVEVVRLRAVEEHPNADRLELAQVGAYKSIVLKGKYQPGDLVAYIPEASVLPDDLIEEMGLTGRLAGKQANRVKAIRLRGIVSQGLCLEAREGWNEGDNVADELGIIKWEPPIPAHMSGAVYGAGADRCMKYDIENWKRYPDILEVGEQVVFTEKIHGTWCQMGLVPEEWSHPKHGRFVCSSKGMSAQGLAFQPEAEQNVNNLYLRAARGQSVQDKIEAAFSGELGTGLPVFLLGEVFGHGVQDLHYGASTARDERLGFRVFDIYVGRPHHGRYLNDDELDAACDRLGVPRVPVLYRGPFSLDAMAEWTTGKETVSGNGMHVREGIVMRPVVERRDDLSGLGRVQLKSVSEKYLFRKGGTEFN
jgi:RNA ligase (TIGR02306 family)